MAMVRGFIGRIGGTGRSVTCEKMRAFRLAIALFALGALIFISRPYAHGLSFVVRVTEMHGAARTIADFDAVRVQERDITIPTTRGAMRARACAPSSPRRAAPLTP